MPLKSAEMSIAGTKKKKKKKQEEEENQHVNFFW